MRTPISYVILLTAGVLVLAACGGAPEPGASPEPFGSEPTQPRTGGVDAGKDGEAAQFVGLTLAEASALAEAQGRQWRVGRRDGEDLALTADLVDRRVTFEVDDGIVVAATVEHAHAETGAGTSPQESVERAQLIAAAVERLVTVDNSFGGGDPFDRIEVATGLGGDPARPIGPLAAELIATALEPLGTVELIDDPKTATAEHLEQGTTGIGVVTVDDVRIDGERAEVDVGLWCGSLCGIWLTYEATLGPEGWEIERTVGPIEVS